MHVSEVCAERVAHLLDRHPRFRQLRRELAAQVVQVRVQAIDVRSGAHVAPSLVQALDLDHTAGVVTKHIGVRRQVLAVRSELTTLEHFASVGSMGTSRFSRSFAFEVSTTTWSS